MKNGQTVLCVDDCFDVNAYEQCNKLPIAGEQYTIEEIFLKKGIPAVYLVGFEGTNENGVRNCFRASRFAEADISELTEILQNEEVATINIAD